MLKRQFINVKKLAEKLSNKEIECKSYSFSETNLRRGLMWFLFCRREKCQFVDKNDFGRLLNADACKCIMNKQ